MIANDFTEEDILNPEKEIWFANAEQEEFYQCLTNLLSDNLGRDVSF